MIKWLVSLIVLTAGVVGALFYWFYLPQEEALNRARREASDCLQEASALHGRIADLEDMLDQVQQSSAQLASQIEQKENELSSARAAQDELMEELKQEIEDGHIQVERLRGQLKVDLVDEILFDSGEAELNPAGIGVLKKVGTILKKAEGRQIVVHGHTDNVQIVGRLAETFPTNWELSAARAVNVTRFLQDTAGMNPKQLSAAGFSEYQPRADNATAEGRQQNRRIEIVLAPAPIVPISPDAEAEAVTTEKNSPGSAEEGNPADGGPVIAGQEENPDAEPPEQDDPAP